MFEEVMKRFEEQAPISVMARVTLEHAIAPEWVDEVFAANRQRQYPRELLFSSVVELMTQVSLGLRPSLHAAARQSKALPVSLTALYEKINRTEPAILRALVQGNAQRLSPLMRELAATPALPGWRLRVLDGNHLPASEKRLAPLRAQHGAALPGHTLVVYEPDLGLVTDIVAIEDAHAQERASMAPLLDSAQAGELWLADRNFCTATILQGWHRAGACFIVREHGCHQRLSQEGPWVSAPGIDTGVVREQTICPEPFPATWRRIELTLDTPTEAGDSVIRLWSNLPPKVSSRQIARLYRQRWCIEGMFQRLESVLHSEIRSLGNPRAALLGFAVAVLAYNVLSVLKRSVEHAHGSPDAPAHTTTAKAPQVSTFYLAHDIRNHYEGMLIALPSQNWSSWAKAEPVQIVRRLLTLGRQVELRRVSTSKRGPKIKKHKVALAANTAVNAHHSTARLLKTVRDQRP